MGLPPNYRGEVNRMEINSAKCPTLCCSEITRRPASKKDGTILNGEGGGYNRIRFFFDSSTPPREYEIPSYTFS